MINRDGIIDYFIIKEGGVPQFVLSKASADVADDVSDTLVAGFLSAIMSFSEELYENDSLSQLELLNRKFFISKILGNNIQVLITDKSFVPTDAFLVLKKMNEFIIDSSLILDDRDGLQKNIPEIISSIFELAIREVSTGDLNSLTSLLESRLQDGSIDGYLVFDNDLQEFTRNLSADLPFEFSVFLESNFWNVYVLANSVITATLDKVLSLDDFQQMSTITDFGTLVFQNQDLGIISLAFSSNKRSFLETSAEIFKEIENFVET